MKKVFVSLLVLMFAASSFAAVSPIDKGSMILGGNVYFQSLGGDYYKGGGEDGATVLAFMPSVGYFVAPSIMIGAVIDFEKASQGDVSATEFGFGPMVGYFFNMDAARTEVKGAMYPYLKAFFMYGKSSYDDGDDETEEIDLKKTTFGGMGGVMFMLSNAVAADISVKFENESYKYDVDGAESVSGTVITFGLGFTAFMWN
jgi:hypothetical protein